MGRRRRFYGAAAVLQPVAPVPPTQVAPPPAPTPAVKAETAVVKPEVRAPPSVPIVIDDDGDAVIDLTGADAAGPSSAAAAVRTTISSPAGPASYAASSSSGGGGGASSASGGASSSTSLFPGLAQLGWSSSLGWGSTTGRPALTPPPWTPPTEAVKGGSAGEPPIKRAKTEGEVGAGLDANGDGDVCIGQFISTLKGNPCPLPPPLLPRAVLTTRSVWAHAHRDAILPWKDQQRRDGRARPRADQPVRQQRHPRVQRGTRPGRFPPHPSPSPTPTPTPTPPSSGCRRRPKRWVLRRCVLRSGTSPASTLRPWRPCWTGTRSRSRASSWALAPPTGSRPASSFASLDGPSCARPSWTTWRRATSSCARTATRSPPRRRSTRRRRFRSTIASPASKSPSARTTSTPSTSSRRRCSSTAQPNAQPCAS